MKTLFTIFLLSVLAVAQTTVHTPGREIPNVFTQPNQFTVGSQLGPQLVANLPASPAVGTLITVTDGSVAGDCTAGGGSSFNLCGWNGFAWVNPVSSNLGVFSSVTTNTLTINGPGGVITIGCQTAPANPLAGTILAYCDSGTGLITFLNSSGGAANPGGAAWSAITASTNTNAGTFFATGNSWDFTGVTIFKMRIGAGLVTSANGDLGYDTTNKNWHVFGNAVDNLIGLLIASGTYVAGDCVKINAINPLTLGDAGAGCGGSSAGAPIFFGSNGANFVTSGTFFIGGSAGPGTAEASHQLSVPRSGTIAGLTCRVANALSSTQTFTFTVFKGLAGNGAVSGSSTTATCVINSTNTNGCVDNTHTFTVALDDLLEVQVVAANTPPAGTGNCTVLFQ